VLFGAILHRSDTPLPHFFKRRNIMEIKVLGPGCPRCETTKKHVEEAVAESNVDAKITKITDTMEIAKHGVFGTPAVIIDGEVKSVGKIPTKEEIKGWIGNK
jgi:small redox-active disulfide protein 2